MFERIDLHTHSKHSDGVLTPLELVSLAATRNVELLALTDHDTIAGCAAAEAACAAAHLQFLPGIELSALWLGREIHVVGLGIDADNTQLREHCATVVAVRRTRAARMVAELVKQGMAADALAAALSNELPDADSVPTRTHLARALVRLHRAETVQDAFDRWLGRSQPAYVPPDWPELAAAVRCILAAHGTPVLAHAHRYKLSAGQLRSLCAEFKGAGGVAIEVSLAGMGESAAERLCALARRFELAGSVGSDFHEPGLPWRGLGRFAKLPDGIVPVTALLGFNDRTH